MRKKYILDTSVLINDPNSFKKFSGHDVIIPINVLDELDKIKILPNDAGKNARICIKALDILCSYGSINKGIKIDNDVFLKIDTSKLSNKFGSSSYIDNKILSCAYLIKQKSIKKRKLEKIILVSKDINLRIRARSFGIEAEDYEKEKTSFVELYQGFKVLINDEIGKTLNKKDYSKIEEYNEIQDLKPNECLYVESKNGDGLYVGRRIENSIVTIKNKKPWGLSLKNKEQAFAVDMLCDPRVHLVSLIGKAGTGKTICAIASALEMVLEQKKYKKMIIYRPIQPVGNDIGYLPGTMEEKLNPWMQAVSDSFEFLFENKNGHKWKTVLDRYLDDGTIQMEAITYIRGRSIHNAFILIDESQNLSKEEVKTILTRAGNGTKIVLTGDIEQIDNTHLDATNNGLTYIVEKFKDIDLAGHITFTKGERSILASTSANIL